MLNVTDGMISVKTCINVENKALWTCWYWPSAVRRYSRTYLLHFIQTFSVLIMEKQCSNSFNLGSPLREVSCIQVSIIRFYLLCASPHVIGPSHMFGKANQRYTLMEENREIKTLTHLMPAAGGKWNQGLMVSTGVGVSQELWVMPQGSSLYYFPWLLLQLMCLHMRACGWCDSVPR